VFMLPKLPCSCQCLNLTFFFPITNHTYSGTKTVATTLEFWNWEQAAFDWTKGECNLHMLFTSPRWDYYSRLRIGCTYFTHGHLRGENPPRCSACQVDLTVEHILLHCVSFTMFVMIFSVLLCLQCLNCFWILPHVQKLISLNKLDFII